jgi:glycosyltransferase involved in cell wall biosynthesis/predicted  nucleic acid-binding Zn-ribbon protein
MHVLLDARLLHRPVSGVERDQICFIRELSGRPEIRRLSVLVRKGTVLPEQLCPESAAGFEVIEVVDIEGIIRVLTAEDDPPDVFHMTHVPEMAWELMLIPIARAVAVTVHDAILNRHPEYFPNREVWAWFDGFTKLIIASADRLMGHTQSVIDETEHDLDGDPGRCDIVPLAPDPSFSQRVDSPEVVAFRAKHGLQRDYFVALGRDYAHKDHPTLIRALARLPEEIELAIAGGKVVADETCSDAVVEELGLGARVNWLPSLADEDLRALLQGSRGLVFPSHEEGFGLPPLEAMLSGVPVIASRAMSIPDVCGDGAWLFEPGDDTELAGLMQRLLAGGQDVDDLIKRGTVRAGSFSWTRTADLIVTSYEKAIATARTRTDRWSQVSDFLTNISQAPVSVGARVHELENELARWQRRGLDAETELVRWKERCEHAETELVRWKERCEHAETELVRWKERCEHAETELVRWKERCEHAETELVRWKDRCGHAETELASWQERCGHAESELASRRERG